MPEQKLIYSDKNQAAVDQDQARSRKEDQKQSFDQSAANTLRVL